jgi:hypothetical protein
MSKRVETGEVISKIRGRPPIEYLRKLAPSAEEAQKYLVLAEKAEIKRLSQLGKTDQLFDVYVPLLDCKVQYGLIAMNEVIEWEEANFNLGKEGPRADQVKAMRKLLYLMLRKADPDLTEETVGEFSPQVVTQILVGVSEQTPFFGASQPEPLTDSTRKTSASS